MSTCKWTVKLLNEDEDEDKNEDTEIPEHGNWRCEHGHKMLVWEFNNLLVTHTHADN